MINKVLLKEKYETFKETLIVNLPILIILGILLGFLLFIYLILVEMIFQNILGKIV